jgi:hypothetical protein
VRLRHSAAQTSGKNFSTVVMRSVR